MRQARRVAFVPAHISGFFQPFITENPERSGSRNCGPCLEEGVTTEVEVRRGEGVSLEVLVDGRRERAETTERVAREIMSWCGGGYSVRISHRCGVPVGAGYGASGAGALGAAMALSDALGLERPVEDLQGAAHRAEVICRTGLGDVGAQVIGGLVLTLSPGAPPHGRWMRIPVPEDIRIVCATMGEIPTDEVLGDPSIMRRVRAAGKKAFERVRSSPTVEEFLSASRGFMEETGLADDDVEELVEVAEGAGAMGASQAMLGRSIFAFCRSSSARRVMEEIRKRRDVPYLTVTRVRERGAELAR
ncbi:MAG: hypothetical protein QW567_01400 [Candidatus Hadarchaeales archaeon]